MILYVGMENLKFLCLIPLSIMSDTFQSHEVRQLECERTCLDIDMQLTETFFDTWARINSLLLSCLW